MADVKRNLRKLAHLDEAAVASVYRLPGILPDHEIRKYVSIQPYSPGRKRDGVISYGESSYGYDSRIGYKFRVFTPVHCTVIDPKNFDGRAFVDVDVTPHDGEHEWGPTFIPGGEGKPDYRCLHCESYHSDAMAGRVGKGLECPRRPAAPDHVLIPPNSFALGETVEEYDLPRDVLAVVLGKSTYARCGLLINVTPGEPEWRGKWTVEMSNTAPLPIKVYAGEGIMQVLFFRGSAPCEVSYKEKKGKYCDQTGLTMPKVD